MPAPRSKYNAVRTTYNGVSYSSKAEAKRAAELDLLVKAGKIRGWIGQPKFRLGCPENVYVADFLVFGWDWVWAEDVKGFRTAKFNHDVKLWKSYGLVPLKVIGKTTEVINPEG